MANVPLTTISAANTRTSPWLGSHHIRLSDTMSAFRFDNALPFAHRTR